MSCRPRAIARVLLLGLCFSGCFGLAHTRVEMPALIVQGVVLDPDGYPLAGDTLAIALSDFYATRATLEALTSDSLGESAQGYRFCAVQTGKDGEFVCRLAGESRYIGFMPPLMCPGEVTLRSFLVGIRTADGSVFAIDVSGSDTKIRVPVGPEFELEKPHDRPFSVDASVRRSEGSDVLQVVIRRKPVA